VKFKNHYTPNEAQALLPDIRRWLARLVSFRDELAKQEQRLEALMAQGSDVGGQTVNGWIRTMADFRSLLMEFHIREIQIKDLDRGLIDFPSILGGKEVFLCWEHGETHVEFWHELETGYAGRQALGE
jgi:hypothetical protein